MEQIQVSAKKPSALAEFAAQNPTITVKGVTGSVEYDDDDDTLWGSFNLSEMLGFYIGNTVPAFKKDFEEAVEFYLEVKREAEIKKKGLAVLNPMRQKRGLSPISSFRVRGHQDAKGRLILKLCSTGEILFKGFIHEYRKEK